MAQNLLTVTQAAKLLNVTRSNIHSAIARGRIDKIKIGSVVLISRVALDAYSKSRQHTGPSKKKKKLAK